MALGYGTAQAIGGQANAMTQPKELGILQRADGLRNGLQSLRSRLEIFSDRLDGNGGSEAKDAASISASLSGTFADAENELRICLHMIDSLNERF